MIKKKNNNKNVKIIIGLMVLVATLIASPYFAMGPLAEITKPVILGLPYILCLFLFLCWALYVETKKPANKIPSILLLFLAFGITILSSPLIFQIGLSYTSGLRMQIEQYNNEQNAKIKDKAEEISLEKGKKLIEECKVEGIAYYSQKSETLYKLVTGDVRNTKEPLGYDAKYYHILRDSAIKAQEKCGEIYCSWGDVCPVKP